MNRKLFSILFCCVIMLMGGRAYAIPVITLSASNNSILPGEVTAVDVGISGLTAGAPLSLGAFSLDLVYTPTFLSPVAWNFGTYLGDETLGEAVTFAGTSLPGTIPAGLDGVYLDEVSLLFDFELDAIQLDSFYLATVYLQGTTLGYGAVGFENAVLSDAWGNVISSPAKGGRLQITVPEPETLLLFGTALAGMLLLRHKRLVCPS